ncbi:MAG: putative branched-chain amino acid transport system substrate-binding protein precursor [Acidimicrobiia bacterium]|nr:putative branched-chain amino acid transport system substrate-binding protein precursor [Acidimicrobiia bacterium]
MRGRIFSAVCILGATALVLGACGDDGGGTKAATTTVSGASAAAPSSGASGAAGAKPTGAPYKLGVPARLSGTGALSYVGVEPSAKAWESWTNDNGGINGHPVQVEVGDAAGDAAKGLALVKKMVETDNVLMLHPEDPTIDPGIATYTQQQKVAVASPFLAYPLWNTTPNWFGLGFPASTAGYSYYLEVVKDQGLKSVGAVVCAEVASCASADAQLSKYAPAAGLRYDGTLKLAASAPNYTAECLSLKNKVTQVLLVAFSIDTTKRVVNDCATQGYNPTFIFPGTVLNDRAAEMPTITAFDALPALPWYADSPALKDYRAALAKYQPGKKADQSGLYTWTTLQWFAESATKAKLPESPTRDQVNTALAANKTNVGGLLADLNFAGAGQVSDPIKCYFAAEYSKGKFLLPKGDKPVCGG